MYKVYKFAPSYYKKVEQFLKTKHSDTTGITQSINIENDLNMIKNYCALKVANKDSQLIDMVERMFEYYGYAELDEVDYIEETTSSPDSYIIFSAVKI